MAATRILRVFRVDPETNERRPWHIVLDQQLTVVHEYDASSSAGGAPAAGGVSEEMRQRHAIARWATEEITENPIPGTDELREAFFVEQRGLLAKFEAQGEKCPPCKLGELQRTYRNKLKDGGFIE